MCRAASKIAQTAQNLVGKSAVFHGDSVASFASYLIRVRFAPEVADPDYVNLWLESAWGRARAHPAKTDRVSQSNINSSKLALMPLPLPPIQEQAAIVRRATETLMVADRLHDRAVKVSNTLDTAMQAVLAKAFRGELEIVTQKVDRLASHPRPRADRHG